MCIYSIHLICSQRNTINFHGAIIIHIESDIRYMTGISFIGFEIIIPFRIRPGNEVIIYIVMNSDRTQNITENYFRLSSTGCC